MGVGKFFSGESEINKSDGSHMHRSTRILLVDDHQVVRAGLAQFIAEHDDLTVAAEASTGNEAINLARQNEFDVVILDISMPDRSGIDALHVIKQLRPDVHVVVLSGYSETHYAVNTLRAGANGYISKDVSPEELIKAIRIVARGHRYLSETAADLVSDHLSRPAEKKAHETLSEREFQIFLKLAAGTNPTLIGKELHLSVKTVGTYRARVLEKMSLTTNADLTIYAIENGLMN